VQAGAAWRYARIVEERVSPRERELDRLFDFGRLMIRRGDVYVLPPVAVRAGRAVRLLEGGLGARGQERSYRLAERARLALGPPDWREYLLADMPAPAETHPSLLPATAAEARLWRERVGRGWATGTEEAEGLFRRRAALLARDYAGMLLYLELQGGGLASATEVSVRGLARSARDEELVYMLTDYGLEGRGSLAAGGGADGEALPGGPAGRRRAGGPAMKRRAGGPAEGRQAGEGPGAAGAAGAAAPGRAGDGGDATPGGGAR
jgi:hypothetical protein